MTYTTAELPSADKTGLQVTVVSFPGRGAGKLVREANVVKGSILYADQVTLISPEAEMWAAFASPDVTRTPRTLFDVLLRFNPTAFADTGIGPALDALRSFETNKNLSDAEREEARAQLEQNLEDHRPRVIAAIEGMVERSNLASLKPALDTGLLTIEGGHTSTGTISGDLFDSWLIAVQRVLDDPARRLVLDDRTSAYVAQQDAGATVGIASRFADAEVGARLLARLPTFPTAPLDELLDLRTDLAGALSRYRAATARFARDVASRSVGPDLRREVEHYWTSDIAASLSDINDQLSDHGLIREIGRALGEDARTLVIEGTAMFVGLNSLTSLSGWASSVASVAAPGAQAIATASRRRQENREAAERHELYYLYAMSKILEKP